MYLDYVSSSPLKVHADAEGMKVWVDASLSVLEPASTSQDNPAGLLDSINFSFLIYKVKFKGNSYIIGLLQLLLHSIRLIGLLIKICFLEQ